MLHAIGRQIFDAKGKEFVPRILEGWYGPTAKANLAKWVSDIASTGANGFRPQLMTGKDPVTLEALILAFRAKRLVLYLPDLPVDAPTAKLIQKYADQVVWDATIEMSGDLTKPADVTAAISKNKQLSMQIRALGFTGLLGLGTVNAGRALRAIIEHGPEIVSADPAHNVVQYWQAYWGQYSGFSYQVENGFSAGDTGIREAFTVVANRDFPIQVGYDARDTGGGNAPVNYQLMLTLAAQFGVPVAGWELKDPDANNVNDMATAPADRPLSLTGYGTAVKTWMMTNSALVNIAV